jgi:hypothetical protein
MSYRKDGSDEDELADGSTKREDDECLLFPATSSKLIHERSCYQYFKKLLSSPKLLCFYYVSVCP